MQDAYKSREQLIDELVKMRRRVAELHAAEFNLQSVADALRQSETMFRKITEKSIVGVYLIQDDLFRYVNPKMAEICGYTVEQLVDKRGPVDVVTEEDWPRVRDNLRKRIAGEMESIHYSFKGKKPDGQVVHMEVYGSRMDYHKRPAVIGTILDMTQRIRAEQELETQLRRFQALHHLAVAMTAEHTLEENLGLLVDKSRELLAADASFIAVCDDKSDAVRIRACSGIAHDEIDGPHGELSIPVRNPGGTTAFDHTRQEEHVRAREGTEEDRFPARNFHSGISAPVRIRDRDLGVLYVCSRSERFFSESDRDLLFLMGNMAALEITRKQVEEALARSEEQLRSLSRQLLRAQEHERKRVARELHDGIGQSVTAMKFKVESVIREASKNVPQEHLAPLEGLLTMIQDVVEDVGRIAMDLRPSILDDLGVMATITWLCREFQKTHPHIRVVTELEVQESGVSEDQKIVIFRILQEALNNVAKHSRADLVRVSLCNHDGTTELTVEDSGVGFDWESAHLPGESRPGFGLVSMKERTQLSGGSLSVRTKPGAGTTITASWPCT
ncbi:MAG: PAS domain S-box protein [Desulfomonilaceae bacterium]|nr:PAS domain S-box protein [Desulfomonilaceae bacterium]